MKNEAGRPALLLIDVQNYVLEPKRHPPRPAFYKRARNLVMPTIERLLPAARRAGLEVVYTVMENMTRDGRDRSLDYKLSGFFIEKGSWDAQVVATAAPEEDEVVLPKTSACLFHSTNFEYLMRNMGVDTIVCAGFLTDQCVEQTMKAGSSRGFAMICLEDACAANDDARHVAALDRLAGFGQVSTSASILSSLERRHA